MERDKRSAKMSRRLEFMPLGVRMRLLAAGTEGGSARNDHAVSIQVVRKNISDPAP